MAHMSDNGGAIVDTITATALTPILLGEIFAVPIGTTTGTSCQLIIQGKNVLGIAKATTHAWHSGDRLFWDAANSVATRTPGPYILGHAAADATAGATTGDVFIDAKAGGVFGQTVADSTAVTAATETPFDTTVTIPANSLADGASFRVRGMVFHTTFAGSETATIKVKIYDGTNTIVLATSAAFDGASSDITVFDCVATVRTDGGTGALVASSLIGIGAPSAGAVLVSGVASSTFDTTADAVVSVTSTNSSTGESAVLRQLVVERLG